MKYIYVFIVVLLGIWLTSFTTVNKVHKYINPFDSIPENTVLLYDSIMPYHVIVNTMQWDASGIEYVIKNGDTANNNTIGNKEIFYIKNIIAPQQIAVIIPTEYGTTTDSTATEIYFEIDSNKVIYNVRLRLYNDSTTFFIPVDSSFFRVIDNNELVLYSKPINQMWNNDTTINQIAVLLEDGLTLSPNGDGMFEYLDVIGIDSVFNYSLSIYNATNSLIINITDKLQKWDCKFQDSDMLVPTGNYKYNIIANSDTLEGQFIIKY